MKTIGYIVMDSGEDFEQALILRMGKELPPGGILDWADNSRKDARAMFASRADAVAAINRTEHYRLAFGDSGLPEKAFCSVAPVCSAPLQGKAADHG